MSSQEPKIRCGRYRNDDAKIDGKVVIITGANIGLGFATAKDLAKRGGKLYLACRSEEKGLEAVKAVKEFSGNENIHFLQLDLASLESVRQFAKKFHELENRLDILVNNAGVLVPGGLTSENFELHMGVNHLGHFLLTNLLLDLLKASDQGRIVVVASKLHAQGSIKRENFAVEKAFSVKGYANSKLANILFTREMAKRLQNTKVTINSCCPGAVNTDALKDFNMFLRVPINFFKKLFTRSPEHGAETQIMLAVEPDVSGVTGKYFTDCKETEPSNLAQDDETAEWLWNESEKLTKLKDKF